MHVYMYSFAYIFYALSGARLCGFTKKYDQETTIIYSSVYCMCKTTEVMKFFFKYVLLNNRYFCSVARICDLKMAWRKSKNREVMIFRNLRNIGWQSFDCTSSAFRSFEKNVLLRMLTFTPFICQVLTCQVEREYFVRGDFFLLWSEFYLFLL